MKEKTADELFEELGYVKYDNHPEDDYPSEPNTWTTQDMRILEYTQLGEVNGNPAKEIITFDLYKQVVICSAFINTKPTIVPLSIEEIFAITKKIQELRMDVKI